MSYTVEVSETAGVKSAAASPNETQPLILSCIISSPSASLTALVSWNQVIIGSSRVYLAGLTLCEYIGTSSSSGISSMCGVSQGSALGPVLFSIYISLIAHIASPFYVRQH